MAPSAPRRLAPSLSRRSVRRPCVGATIEAIVCSSVVATRMQRRALVKVTPVDDAQGGRQVVAAALAERRAAGGKAYLGSKAGGRTGDARPQQLVRVR